MRAVLLAGAMLASAACAPSLPLRPSPGQPTLSSGERTPPAAPATSHPSSLPSEPMSPTPEETGRPLVPVPNVRPRGVVEPPPGRGLARYRSQRVEWQACGQPFQCARVLAPLDYAVPDGLALTLTMARRPATAERRLGSLVINPGGPGGSGLAYVGSFDHAGLEGYDIVGWDPRGVGASTPVECFGAADLDQFYALDTSPDDAAELNRLIGAEQAFGRSCLERSGGLLRHVSTAETVRDLDLLRELLGETALSYFGSSYGTRIGARYADAYPARVSRMVLDGAVDLNRSTGVDQIDGFERALGHFATWCAAQGCRLGTDRGEVLRHIARFLDSIDSAPLAVEQRTLSQQQAVAAVFYALYSRSSWSALRDALEGAAFAGDGGPLLRLADVSARRDPDGSYGQLAYAFPAIRCLDSQDESISEARRRAAAVSRDAPVLGPLDGLDLACAVWPVASAPPAGRADAKGAPPLVVIGTTGDPATPYEYAQGMAKDLDSAVLVTYEGEGHLAYDQSACVRSLVVAYLAGGATPADGTRCRD